MFQSQTKASHLRGFCISNTLISDCYRRSIACNGRCPSQQCKHCCLQIVRFAGGVQVRCPQKKKKHEQSSCLSFCGAVYAKQMVLSHRCVALTLRVYLFAMSAALDLDKCFALVSLSACGLPRLAHQRLLPKVNRVQRTVPVPTMQALLPANCSICRGSSSSVSAKKEKTRTKFVLIFLWCGHRDLNSDGVTIRPSNVRVCLFRHDRLTLLII